MPTYNTNCYISFQEKLFRGKYNNYSYTKENELESNNYISSIDIDIGYKK